MEQKRSMGRPRKAPEERRDERLPHPRVTTEERAFIEAQAVAVGLDVSEYIRRRALQHRIPPARAVADDRLLLEINRIGVNLNQISKAAHLGKTLEGKLAAALDELHAAMMHLADTKHIGAASRSFNDAR